MTVDLTRDDLLILCKSVYPTFGPNVPSGVAGLGTWDGWGGWKWRDHGKVLNDKSESELWMIYCICSGRSTE